MTQLEESYRQRFGAVLEPLAISIERHLSDLLREEARIDRIVARAKSVDRFLKKSRKVNDDGTPKYPEPLEQIQDQVGARVVTFYSSDVERISSVIDKYLRPVETRNIVPDSEWEFGYFGRHYVLLIPSDVIDASFDQALTPTFFELQVKTLFQHAWSEANHDLGYKPETAALSADAKRRLAFTSAQAWGADRVFDELFRELNAASAS